ncbi:MAG: RAMP superfamily CRISPR-associated protein [Nitrososphaerota archaeon]
MYKPQREASIVRVVRRPYTPRDRLLEGRFNVKLRLKAEVPNNSYVFIWRGKQREVDLAPLLKNINNLLNKGQLIQNLRKIEQLIAAMKPSAPVNVREPPMKGGVPYIPASSIKGAARSRLEYKFSPKRSGDGLVSNACYIVQDGEVGERHRNFWGNDATYRREGPCDVKGRYSDKVCIVCDIFGAPSLSSRVDFSDAIMTAGNVELLTDLKIRAFKPGSSFVLSCIGRNFNYEELGLLYLSLELFSGSPVMIGFGKYSHNPIVGQPYGGKYYFGLMRFNLEEVTIFNGDLSSQSILPRQSIEKAKSALEQSEHHPYLDYEKGVIRYG